MFVNSFSVENQMKTKFRCAGCRILQGGQVLNGEKLPFELFLYAEKGQFRLFINSETVICPPLGTVLIPCDTAFRLETDDGCELIFIGADYRIYTSAAENGIGPCCFANECGKYRVKRKRNNQIQCYTHGTFLSADGLHIGQSNNH